MGYRKALKGGPRSKDGVASHCAPGRRGLTCFTMGELTRIAKRLNEQEGAGIKMGSKEDIWRGVRKHLSGKCSTEVCWIDQDFLQGEPDLKEAFVPKMPGEWKKNKYEWLSNFDIDAVMEQYERAYPDYLFLGTVPSDCPNGYLCELSGFDPVKMMKGGKKRAGIVYNLDEHTGPGTHWVATFIDLSGPKKEISYYDSYGAPPPDNIGGFLVSIRDRLRSKGYQAEVLYNTTRHQFGGSECGIYSMNYLINRLKGESMKKAVNRKIPDRLMNEMRTYLYRPGG